MGSVPVGWRCTECRSWSACRRMAFGGKGWEADIEKSPSLRHALPMKQRLMIVVLALLGLADCHGPQPTYEADCSVPPASFGTAKEGIGHLTPLVEATIDHAGAIKWAGRSVSIRDFESYVIRTGELLPMPQLILNPSPDAPCESVERVRTILEKAELCKADGRWCSEGHDPKNWPIVGGP